LLLDALFKKDPGGLRYAQMLSGNTPIFSQYGNNIYSYDIVNECVDCIASELSKLQPRHIRRDPATGKLLKPATDTINRLLKKPNKLMNIKDFIEKIIWTLYLNSNAFIYPSYDIVTDARGLKNRAYTGFWPLNPIQVDFLEDVTGELFIKLTFGNGKNTTLPYADIIHLRKKYSINDILGGSISGNVDNTALLSTLRINDAILTGTAASIAISQGIKGILKVNTVLDSDKREAERKSFMDAIAKGDGIVPMDFKGDFVPVTIDAKTIDAETLKFVENKILRWFGVSIPVLDGVYTDAEYSAFYNKTLELAVTALNQGFTMTLFSPTELSHGNEIVFYQNALELTDIKNKLAIMDTLGNRGAFSNNEARQLFGLPPIDGGDEYYTSLNFINVAIADQYQLNRAGIDSKTPESIKKEESKQNGNQT
jgi:HK97 family phage portal protein